MPGGSIGTAIGSLGGLSGPDIAVADPVTIEVDGLKTGTNFLSAKSDLSIIRLETSPQNTNFGLAQPDVVTVEVHGLRTKYDANDISPSNSGRTISSEYSGILDNEIVYPVLFAELDFQVDPVRAFTGYGEVYWDNRKWVGTGEFGSVGDVTEEEQLKSHELNLQLDGVDPDILATALEETRQYQGREAGVYLGFFDTEEELVVQPHLLFRGEMDVLNVQDSGDESKINLTVISPLHRLKEKNERRFTKEDQQDEYAKDKFFNYVNEMQEKKLTFGPPK